MFVCEYVREWLNKVDFANFAKKKHYAVGIFSKKAIVMGPFMS